MLLSDILASSGVEIHPHSVRANEINMCCPFCQEQGESEDIRFRLGVNTASGRAQCFNCGWRSGSLTKTVHELCRVFGLRYSIRSTKKDQELVPAKPKAVEAVEIGYPEEYEPFSSGQDDIQQQARQYLRDRGISLLQIHRHHIGYAAAGRLAWRVLFPVLDTAGKCFGCVGRDFSGKQRQKYLNTPGVKMLWGAEFPGSTAVVCEGVLDALRVEQALMSTPASVAVARLGSTITDIQLNQLKAFDKVIIMPDWDEPGVTGAITLAVRTVSARIPTSICIPDAMTGDDPGSMDIPTILDVLASAVPYSKSTEFRLRTRVSKR